MVAPTEKFSNIGSSYMAKNAYFFHKKFNIQMLIYGSLIFFRMSGVNKKWIVKKVSNENILLKLFQFSFM